MTAIHALEQELAQRDGVFQLLALMRQLVTSDGKHLEKWSQQFALVRYAIRKHITDDGMALIRTARTAGLPASAPDKHLLQYNGVHDVYRNIAEELQGRRAKMSPEVSRAAACWQTGIKGERTG
jgi:hypothetical protein